MIIRLLLLSVGTLAISGVPSLLLGRRSAMGQWIAAGLNVIASGLGGAALLLHYLNPSSSREISAQWALPLGRFAVAVDDLSIVFLIPIFLISAIGSIYGLSYWNQRRHPSNGRQLRFCWGVMSAGMALVVLARDGVLFLMVWEVMALAAFFLATTEGHKSQVRQAGWVYLVATHVGGLCLFAFFALLHYVTGSFDLWPAALTGIAPNAATALFVLGAVGFGFKAGVMPLHVWLPGAHANAPSHVSAILSGVLLKMGIYGMVRIGLLLAHPPLWWGGTFLVAGALSGILGIAFAAGQQDFKRLLAYSSIENIGIITMGIGLAMLGRSRDRADWIALGLGGALLHMLNHSLFKPLLFLGAGSILHAARTRKMDLLGGLGKAMPRTFILFVIGALAICGLPPLNGFVGELLLYLGFFKTTAAKSAGWGWVALAAPALALIGAMAVASFVKLVGTVFTGSPRTPRAAHAHDPASSMLAPMSVLAICCVLIGLFPIVVVGLLNRAISAWGQVGSLTEYVPLGWITAMGLALLIPASIVGLWLIRWRPRRSAPTAGTWDCGFARPTARIQYSGSSFSQMLIDLLAWIVWPRKQSPKIGNAFPASTCFTSDLPDVVLDRGLLPGFALGKYVLRRARIFQRVPIQVYLLYVLVSLLLLLLFA